MRATVSGTTSKRIGARVEPDDGEARAVDRDGVADRDAVGDRVGRLDDQRHAAPRVAFDRSDAAVVQDQAGEHVVRSAESSMSSPTRSMRSNRHPFRAAQIGAGEGRDRRRPCAGTPARRARRRAGPARPRAAGRPASGPPSHSTVAMSRSRSARSAAAEIEARVVVLRRRTRRRRPVRARANAARAPARREHDRRAVRAGAARRRAARGRGSRAGSRRFRRRRRARTACGASRAAAP